MPGQPVAGARCVAAQKKKTRVKAIQVHCVQHCRREDGEEQKTEKEEGEAVEDVMVAKVQVRQDGESCGDSRLETGNEKVEAEEAETEKTTDHCAQVSGGMCHPNR